MSGSSTGSIPEIEVVRSVRAAYDDDARFGRGHRAGLRRARTSDEILSEGAYWHLLSLAKVPEPLRYRLASVVLCFPAAGMSAAGSFSLGRWLKNSVYAETSEADLPTRATRFRRLLAVRNGDREGLVHQLRKLVQHGAQKSNSGVDWGIVGADILRFGDTVRRRWAADFFAISVRNASQSRGEGASHG